VILNARSSGVGQVLKIPSEGGTPAASPLATGLSCGFMLVQPGDLHRTWRSQPAVGVPALAGFFGAFLSRARRVNNQRPPEGGTPAASPLAAGLSSGFTLVPAR
jgi:hypothetical protein